MPTRNRHPWRYFRKWLLCRFEPQELVGAYNEPSSNPIAQFLQARINRQISVTTVQMYAHAREGAVFEDDFTGWSGPPPEWVKYFLRISNKYGTGGRMQQRTALKILEETIKTYRKAQ